MAFVSMHAYDADIMVPSFLGLNQADVGLNPDTRFAAEAENVETPHGVLQPRAASAVLNATFQNRIETLLRFHRRYYAGEGSKDFLVAATGGRMYQAQEGSDDWEEVELPDGMESFQSNVWSWVTYEYNFLGSQFPVDVLLISNAYDGMYMIVPSDISRTWGVAKMQTWGQGKQKTWRQNQEPTWLIVPVDTKGNKFNVIARHDERIWGGGIIGEEDKLMYSAPYDPMDWEQNTEIPEDGAGEIFIPTWDGDKFTTLEAFGDQMICFKQRRLWRIIGTNPGEYDVREQYGGGAPFPYTVVIDVERMLMADVEGVSVYDGMSVTPFARNAVERIWKTVNRAAMDQMCAAIFNKRYYLAFPVGDSTVNNALLIYDFNENTILYHTDVYIENMLATDTKLYATSSSLPGKILDIRYDSWESGEACGEATKWVSPWMDFGRKDVQKGGFDVYLIPEVQSTPVTLIVSMQTEKKTKTKQYTVQPVAEGSGRESKGKRLHFGGNGRRFRFIIETADGVTAPWRLIGGLHLIAETDPD